MRNGSWGRIECGSGISISPAWSDQNEILDVVRLAEEAGLDLVVQDYPYQWRFYYTWTRGFARILGFDRGGGDRGGQGPVGDPAGLQRGRLVRFRTR